MSSKPDWVTEPGEGFKPQMQEWMNAKLEWRRKHREYIEKSVKKAETQPEGKRRGGEERR